MSFYDKILAFWKQQRNIGLEGNLNLSLDETMKIQARNEIILLGIISNAIKGIFCVLIGYHYIHHLIHFGWLSIFFAGYVLARNYDRSISLASMMTFSLLFIFSLQALLGKDFVVEPLYAMFIYTIILFYTSKVQNIIFIIVACAYALGVYINLTGLSSYGHLLDKSYQLTHFTDNIIFFFYVVKRTLDINKENKIQLRQKEQTIAQGNEQLDNFNNAISNNLQKTTDELYSFAQELKAKADDPVQQKDLVNLIIQSGYQITNMVESINEFQEASDINIHKEKLSLNNILEKIKLDLQGFTTQKNAQVTYEPLPNINSDKYILSVVLKKVITNAIQFNDKKNPQVYIWCEEKQDAIYLYLRDNGSGIPKEKHKRIFDIFTFLDNSKNVKTIGLGLSISRRMLALLDSNIDIAESTIGKGSTFYIQIPISSADTIHSHYQPNLQRHKPTPSIKETISH